MNTLVREEFEILHMTQALRDQLMESLTDADLAYRLPGANPSLGELCRQMGEVQHNYINSFRTFKQDWSYKNDDPGIEQSVQRLTTWFKALENDLDAVLQGLSEEDLLTKTIDRGDFSPLVRVQFHIYREALLIYYGKANVYLKALNKPLTEQWQAWIG